jgi:ABC-type multidrug transport system fused ATPase/permease subunit
MAIRPVTIPINGDTSGFERALSRTQTLVRNFAVAGAAALGTVTAGLTAMSVAGVRAAREVEILSQRANATPVQLQRMAAAGRRVGVDMRDMSDILQDVNDRIGDFLQTGAGEMADFFEVIAPRVGVTADQFRNLSGPDALQLYVSTLERAGVNQQEMTFYMEAMSSESTRLLPLLRNNGAQMRALGDAAAASGAIISESMIASINDANNSLDVISASFSALQMRLAAEVAPALQSVADQFSDFLGSDAARQAIDRLSDAFGALADAATSEGFLEAVAGGLTNMLTAATAAVEGIVWLTQNVEIFTAAATAASVAIYAMGGPITLLVGTISAATAGLVAMSRGFNTQQTAADAARIAQEALNRSLGGEGGYNSLTPTAQTESLTLAVAYEEEARQALQAAEANYELAASRLAAVSGFGEDSLASNPAAPGIAQEYEDAAENVRLWREELSAASRTVYALRVQIAEGIGGGGGGDTGDDTPPSVTPGGGGGGGADDLQQRLDTLLAGIQSEREILEEWYAEGLQTLQDARDAELLTEEAYLQRRAELRREYAEAEAQIEQMRWDNTVGAVGSGIGEVLSAMGQGNRRMLAASKAFNAGMAWIDTIAGAARELRNGTFGFASAAEVIAKGLTFVNAINGVSLSGGGGGGGASTAAASPAPAMPTQNIVLDLVGATPSQVNQYEQLADSFNEAIRQGYLPNVMVSA